MNDGFAWWLILVGLAIGVFIAWLLIARLARNEDDVSAIERAEEAEWISATIERDGGVAPVTLIDEVLGLHQTYLRSPGQADPSVAGSPLREAMHPLSPGEPRPQR